MQFTDKDRLIVAQVAVKAAVEIAHVKAQADDLAPTGAIVADTRHIYDLIFATAEGTQTVPQPAPVVAAPPVVQPVPQPAPLSMPQPAPEATLTPQQTVEMITTQFQGAAGEQPVNMAAVPPAQAQITNDSPIDVKWSDALLHNPNNWEDRRQDPKSQTAGGRGPDFRHKFVKNGRWPVGLWVQSGDTPGWVTAKLGGNT